MPKPDQDEQAAQKKLASLKPLLEKFRQQQAAGYETLEEILQLVNSSVSLADQMKAIELAFATLWGARYGNTFYAWNMKDRVQTKRLLKILGQQELERRIPVYVRNNDLFFTRARHSYGVFVATINQHATEAPTAEFALTDGDAPIGCQHQPPCLNDVAHTKLVNMERRGEGPF